MTEKNFKILYFGVAQWVPSAYGKNTNLFLENWTNWFDIDCLFHHGLRGGPLKLYINNREVMFASTMEALRYTGVSVKYWFEMTESSVVFQHFDTWILEPHWIEKWEVPVVTYSPVDCVPVSSRMVNSLTGAVQNVAMSKFAQEQYKRADIESVYIPHCYDEKKFFPMDKQECREMAKFPEWADFIVGIVATNLGPRKNIPNQLKAFKMFLEMTPGAKDNSLLHLHTHMAKDFRNPEGADLYEVLEQLDLKKNVTITDQDHYIVGLTDEELNMNYNCMDVLLQCTMGEGFGLPTIEAHACGVPVIGSRNSATTEVIGQGGVTIECPCEIQWSRYNSWQSIPRTTDIAEVLRLFYQNRNMTKEYGEKGKENAKQYTTEAVMPMWKELFESL